MEQNTFERVMKHIMHSIEYAGYDSYDQIKAYLLTSDENYITREGKARDYIKQLDKDMIRKYMKSMR